MSSNRVIFIITGNFFNHEAYLMEEELRHLSKQFDKIYLIDTTQMDRIVEDSGFVLPTNAELLNINIFWGRRHWIGSLIGLFNPVFWKELKNIKSVYKIRRSLIVLKILIASMSRGKMKMRAIENLIQEKGENTSQLYLYSYWLDESAYSIALLKAKYPEAKAFSRAHNSDIYFEKSEHRYLPLREFVFDQLDSVFSISKDGRDYMQQKLPFVSAGKIQLSRLGTRSVDTLDFSKKNTDLKIVSLSIVAPVKRIKLIIDALAQLEKIKVDWYHLGGGPDYAMMSAYADEKLKGRPNITYRMVGEKPRNEVYNLLYGEAFDFLLNVSSYEGVPMSIMEAMSVGIPVMATDVGGTSEIVNDKNGRLLESNPSAKKLMEEIVSFNEDLNKSIAAYRQAAYDTWSTTYNESNNFPEFVSQVLKL